MESARHRLTRLRLPAEVVSPPAAERSVTEIAVGRVRLEVVFEPPPGQKLDTRDGPATRLLVSAAPPALLRSGEGAGSELSRALETDPAVGPGVLHVVATAASCDAGPDVLHPACHVHRREWRLPVRPVAGARTGWRWSCPVRTARAGRPVRRRTRRCSRRGCGGADGSCRRRPEWRGYHDPPTPGDAAEGRDADQSDDHEDDADQVKVDTLHVPVGREREDCSHGDEDDASAEAHECRLPVRCFRCDPGTRTGGSHAP